MGCVFGKESAARDGASEEVKDGAGRKREGKKEENLSVESSRNEVVSSTDVVEVAKDGENGVELSHGGAKEDGEKEEKVGKSHRPKGEKRRSRQNPKLSNLPKNVRGEQVAAGWPSWLTEVAGEAINGWIPRKADTFEKIDKIGQGTYSNVYKARDSTNGKIVALKKVRFDNLEKESVKFMAREILILRRLDHPNVI